MSVQLHLLNADHPFEKLGAKIENCFAASLKTIEKKLGRQNVDIVLYVDPERAIPELGIAGYAPSYNRIHIAIDPDHPNLNNNFETVFPRTLAHELHHCARWCGPGYGKTLGEALISEGLACLFEAEICNKGPLFYACTLQPEQLAALSARASAERESLSYDHAAWFYGTIHHSIPKYAGYSIGYVLVSKYSLSHNRQASQLVAAPASAFFEEYSGRSSDF